MRMSLAVVALGALCACSGSSEIDLGEVAVGTSIAHVLLEGSGKVGEHSRYAVAFDGNVTKPDSVHCWWGVEADSESSVAATFDAADGDFDCRVVRQDATGRLWISLTYGTTTSDGSIAVP